MANPISDALQAAIANRLTGGTLEKQAGVAVVSEMYIQQQFQLEERMKERDEAHSQALAKEKTEAAKQQLITSHKKAQDATQDQINMLAKAQSKLLDSANR